MNIINKSFLKLALLPSSFYQRMGVDTLKLKAIVTTKLMMDDRRPNSIQQTRRNKEKKISSSTIGTMLVSGLIGLFYLLFFSIGNDIVTQLTFYLTVFFFMLSLTLISDFTSVLIDIRDNQIILPKPVSDRTFVLARLLHIFIHLCKIVLPMSLAGLVYMLTASGIYGAILFLLLILFTTAISIFFINAVYIFILKITTPQRFQSIISYVQIFFAIVMYGSYQLFPRLLSTMSLDDFKIGSQTGIEAYPVYWLANTWQVLFELKGSTTQAIMAVAGVAFPFLCTVAVIRYLAPSFNQKLALLNSSTAGPTKAKAVQKSGKRSYANWLGKLFTGSQLEKAGFLFTWRMTSRSRDFKVKVYPSIGYMVVYVFILFFNSRKLSLADLAEESTKAKFMVLGAIYFTSFLLIMAIGQIVYSERFKAAWILYSSPVEKPGEIIAGATKAAIFKFYIPIVVFITLAGLVLIGPKVLPNIVFGLFNQVLIAAIMVYGGNKYFPFSLQQSNNVKTGSFLRGLVVLFCSALVAICHYLIYSVLPAIGICALLSVTASWLLFDSIKRLNWNRIESSYQE
ncbi:MAG TPA: hypothetical protein VMR70_05655 [Flavisolibacter sp.]|nr:hypothetical protein [Flavisolibacter sp.]